MLRRIRRFPGPLLGLGAIGIPEQAFYTHINQEIKHLSSWLAGIDLPTQR